MTRINTIHVKNLTNKHLTGEYHEITRIFTEVAKLVVKGKTYRDVEIPDEYCLGRGHMKFFYNKLHWIQKRYSELYAEMIRRGYLPNKALFDKILEESFETLYLFGGQVEWQPEYKDFLVNIQRLVERQ